MKKQPVTLKDIAKRLGVSVTTVSRALHGYRDIKEDTRNAVMELAKEMNYRPNPVALNLRKNRSNVIGVMIPETVHHFFSSVINGIVEVADQNGFTVMLCQSNESYEREKRDVGMLLNARVDGLLISLANDTSAFGHLEECVQMGVPVVLFDKVTDTLHASKVVVDDYQGGFAATEHLIEQGCKRVAHMRGPVGPQNSHARYQGYLDALKKHQLPVEDELVKICTRVSQEEGELFTQEWMESPNPPDGIFTAADLAAIGAIIQLKKMGKKVPQEVAVVGFSDWRIAQIIEPQLSSVYQPGFEMGNTAARILIEEIEANDADQEVRHHTKTLATALKVRGSSLRRP